LAAERFDIEIAGFYGKRKRNLAPNKAA